MTMKLPKDPFPWLNNFLVGLFICAMLGFVIDYLIGFGGGLIKAAGG